MPNRVGFRLLGWRTYGSSSAAIILFMKLFAICKLMGLDYMLYHRIVLSLGMLIYDQAIDVRLLTRLVFN
jgi:hypothetical protein